ncbi:hypothetical protein ACYSNW_13440 [Enterococcus sp. LJL99]
MIGVVINLFKAYPVSTSIGCGLLLVIWLFSLSSESKKSRAEMREEQALIVKESNLEQKQLNATARQKQIEYKQNKLKTEKLKKDLENKHSKGEKPDWQCPYCRSINSGDMYKCPNCSGLSSKVYN